MEHKIGLKILLDRECISGRLFEDEPSEIYSLLSEKGKKSGSDLHPRSSKITPTKEKDWWKGKSEEEKGRRREKQQWLHAELS